MSDYTDDQLLAMAMANIGEYIHQHGTPDYVLIDQEDPRNEEDYDTWCYGTEPLPQDHTWRSTSIDVSPGNGDMAESVDATDLKSVGHWP